jgi:hypothetical protein
MYSINVALKKKITKRQRREMVIFETRLGIDDGSGYNASESGPIAIRNESVSMIFKGVSWR